MTVAVIHGLFDRSGRVGAGPLIVGAAGTGPVVVAALLGVCGVVMLQRRGDPGTVSATAAAKTAPRQDTAAIPRRCPEARGPQSPQNAPDQRQLEHTGDHPRRSLGN